MVQKMKEFFASMGVFFIVNMLTAAVTACVQIPQAMELVRGLSVTSYWLMFVYMTSMAMVARDTWENKLFPKKKEKEVLFIYIVWALVSLALGATVVSNPDYEWSRNDSYALLIAAFSAALSGAWSFIFGVPLHSAAPKSIFAIGCKATPQFLIASKILEEGGSGHAGLALLAGMVSILMRLGSLIEQAVDIWKADGPHIDFHSSDVRQRRAAMRWMLLAESLNGLSWLAVCVAWMYQQNWF